MSVSELRTAAAPGRFPLPPNSSAAPGQLAPKLRERALKAERDRNIPRELVEEYIEAGLIHTLQPKRWGGYEHDHEVAFDIAIELGKSTCGSSAWCLNYLADHACILAHFPEEAQHDVWSENKAACIATSAAPTGKVTVAPGGYRLDGRWSWCSGLRALAVDHDRRLGVPRRRGSSRHAALPRAGVAGEAGRHLVLRRFARVRLDHLRCSTTCSCPSTAAFRFDPARCAFARLEGQPQSDLSHAVHRRAYLCAARARARACARRLCRFRAMDARSAT